MAPVSLRSSAARLATRKASRTGQVIHRFAVGRQSRVKLAERIALFIDGDHNSVREVTAMIQELEKRGRVVLRRFFADEYTIQSHQSKLEGLNVTPVAVPKYLGGTKDVTDMRIAWEVALLVAGTNTAKKRAGLDCGNFTAVAVASHDTDFLELLQQVRTLQDLRVCSCRRYQVIRSSRNVRTGLHDRAADAGVEIVSFELPGQAQSNLRIRFHQGQSTVSVEHVVRPENNKADVDDIERTLRDLGYLGSSSSIFSSPSAIGLFFFVNDLGPVTIEPIQMAVQHTIEKLKSQAASTWVANPGNLVFFEPLGAVGSKRKKLGSANAARMYTGGGPFILRDSPSLVDTVLQRMRYADFQKPEHLEAAVQCFCIVNQKRLLQRGMDTQRLASMSCQEQVRTLHRLFVANVRQIWKVPLSDAVPREILLAKGLLSSAAASEDDVLVAMWDSLTSEGVCQGPAPRYYLGVVAKFVRHMERNHPHLRKPFSVVS